MFSSLLSRVSTAVFAFSGLALLFVPDVIVPHLIPTFPVAAVWVIQLLAAAWLALAHLNWRSRSALLGGIYGRAVVGTNVIVHFISATTLVNVTMSQQLPATIWLLTVPFAALALLYGWLLMRGPLPHDAATYARMRTGSPSA